MRKLVMGFLFGVCVTLSALPQAQGNWFTRLIGIEKPHPAEVAKSDQRRVR